MNSYQNNKSPFETITGPNPLDPASRDRLPDIARAADKKGGNHFAPKDSASQDGNEKPRSKKSAPKVALAIGITLLAAGYGAGAYVFANRYYPGTQIAGVDVSWLQQADAASRLQKAAMSYSLTITGNDFSWTYRPVNATSLIDADRRTREMLEHSESLIWPVKLFESLSSPTSSSSKSTQPVSETPDLPDSFDEGDFKSKLQEAVDSYNQGRSGVFDAASAYDASLGTFTLEQAKKNVKIKDDGIYQDALRAIAMLDTDLELTQDDFEQFATGATGEQLSQACAQANELIGADLALKLGGTDVGSLDGSTLSQFITFDDALAPALDSAKLEEWIRTLASTLDTVGTLRTYTRPDGKTVQIDGGTYGWNVDEDQLVSSIQDAVANKIAGDLEIPCTSSGAVFTKQGEKDWAEYVDIDLTEQHARYYDASGTLQWESGCITGNPNKGNATPTGVYRMNQCGTNITLRGAIDPETGEREYETPVKYWMPFIGGAVGLHDADWQSSASFSNPSAYTYVGSHGCVNLPPDKAGELYSLVKQGICVIVHW
ncbi:L,D-transpeptidase family protein [Collinsella tanakaei]|uniref:L,D-transpeptidase family protein n=1 Tax=Collinsella tanakaei TaxID=626935 RepID=UPI0026599A85|nr:L,D-transpeptidase family protein [Collinsella tanakaei]